MVHPALVATDVGQSTYIEHGGPVSMLLEKGVLTSAHECRVSEVSARRQFKTPASPVDAKALDTTGNGVRKLAQRYPCAAYFHTNASLFENNQRIF